MILQMSHKTQSKKSVSVIMVVLQCLHFLALVYCEFYAIPLSELNYDALEVSDRCRKSDADGHLANGNATVVLSSVEGTRSRYSTDHSIERVRWLRKRGSLIFFSLSPPPSFSSLPLASSADVHTKASGILKRRKKQIISDD